MPRDGRAAAMGQKGVQSSMEIFRAAKLTEAEKEEAARLAAE